MKLPIKVSPMTMPGRPWTATCRGDSEHLIVANTEAAVLERDRK